MAFFYFGLFIIIGFRRLRLCFWDLCVATIAPRETVSAPNKTVQATPMNASSFALEIVGGFVVTGTRGA